MSVTLILSVRITITRLCTPSVAGGCSSRHESSVEALRALPLFDGVLVNLFDGVPERQCGFGGRYFLPVSVVLVRRVGRSGGVAWKCGRDISQTTFKLAIQSGEGLL
jgi:hypothetical protein